jgi:hypothetical protein
MDNDMKWVAMLMLVVIVIPMGGMALNDHQKSQCRIEAIKACVEADKINMACEWCEFG